MNRMGLKVAAVVAAMFLVVQPAQAKDSSDTMSYYKSGNDLVNVMREYDKAQAGTKYDAYDVGSFMGYLQGATDATASRGLYELPDGVTVGQIAAIVSKFLNANPENWNLPAAALITLALMEAFPAAKQ